MREFVDTGLLVDIMNAGLIINSFGKKIPHCSVDTVTQAVMQLIEDPTYNGTSYLRLFALLLTMDCVGATLAVLPKGVIKNIEQPHVDLRMSLTNVMAYH